MPYFSRLTDIVTCNLSSLIESAENPRSALAEIIHEMSEGVIGAERSVKTALNNVGRIESEIGEQRQAVAEWIGRAEEALRQSEEAQARAALERKLEVEDLIAGLEQQLRAAIATRDHLQTLWHALQARLADARRRLDEMESGEAAPRPPLETAAPAAAPARPSRVDLELEELRKQLRSRS